MKNFILIPEPTSVDMKNVNKDDLVDVDGFIFDNNIPQEQRSDYIVTGFRNPYCFRVGDVGVKLEFTKGAPALQYMFANFL